MKSIKKQLLLMKSELGFYATVNCSKEEIEQYNKMLKEKKSLPDDVFDNAGNLDNPFYRYEIIEGGSENQLQEYLMLKQAKHIQIIKNCAVFFTVVAVIGIVTSVLLLLNMQG